MQKSYISIHRKWYLILPVMTGSRKCHFWNLRYRFSRVIMKSIQIWLFFPFRSSWTGLTPFKIFLNGTVQALPTSDRDIIQIQESSTKTQPVTSFNQPCYQPIVLLTPIKITKDSPPVTDIESRPLTRSRLRALKVCKDPKKLGINFNFRLVQSYWIVPGLMRKEKE